MSLFFATHRYDAPSIVALETEPTKNIELTVVKRASEFVNKIKKISDLY